MSSPAPHPLRACPGCGSTSPKPRYHEPPFEVVECRRCGLVYLGNPPHSGRDPGEEALYEAYHAGPEHSTASYRADGPDAGLRELYALNEQRVAVLKQLGAQGRLLDVGCGRGYFLETARRFGFEASGIDVSARAVQYARTAFSVPATTQTVEDLQAAGDTYAVITLWHVLEHFIDPFSTLQALYTLLAPGGLCFVEVPNLHSLKFMLARQKWEGGNHPQYHRTFFSSRTLRRAFREAGFATVRRVPLSYRIPGRNKAYEVIKRGLNAVALDAFLDVAAWR